MTDDTSKNPNPEEAEENSAPDDEATQMVEAPAAEENSESSEAEAPDHSEDPDAFDALDSLDQHGEGAEEKPAAEEPVAEEPAAEVPVDEADSPPAAPATPAAEEPPAEAPASPVVEAPPPPPPAPPTVNAELPESAPGVASKPVETEVESASQMVENLQTSLSVEMGRVSMSLRALGELRTGQIVELSQKPGDSVDLVVGDKSIGKGELVNIEGELGVRILSLVK